MKQAICSATKLTEFLINSIRTLLPSSTTSPPTLPLPTQSDSTSSFKSISTADVSRAIKDLPHTESHGDDNITSHMLRLTSDAISSCLASIFNMSIKECIFPDIWKMAIVVPVHKKGDTSDMSNYRPVSLLSLISKVFEKIICRQVNDYLEEHVILSPTQNGFCRRLSCETALTHLTNLLFSARRNMLYTAVVTIDYTKGFDVINFNHLLNALSSAGLGTEAIA